MCHGVPAARQRLCRRPVATAAAAPAAAPARTTPLSGRAAARHAAAAVAGSGKLHTMQRTAPASANRTSGAAGTSARSGVTAQHSRPPRLWPAHQRRKHQGNTSRWVQPPRGAQQCDGPAGRRCLCCWRGSRSRHPPLQLRQRKLPPASAPGALEWWLLRRGPAGCRTGWTAAPRTQLWMRQPSTRGKRRWSHRDRCCRQRPCTRRRCCPQQHRRWRRRRGHHRRCQCSLASRRRRAPSLLCRCRAPSRRRCSRRHCHRQTA